jgi:hypothetical protein
MSAAGVDPAPGRCVVCGGRNRAPSTQSAVGLVHDGCAGALLDPGWPAWMAYRRRESYGNGIYRIVRTEWTEWTEGGYR